MSAPTVIAVIDLDLTGPTISRHVYGHFAEHLGRCVYGGFWVGEGSATPNEDGIRLDIIEALRSLGIPNLRWPGGCFADDYHWRDGIGPRKQRPRMVNSHWGDVVEDNAFGTHEFMALCELLGADPYVSGNIGSGSVREMSEWIEYLTRGDDSPMASLRRENGRDEPWRIPFWGLGNEAWGCGGNLRAEQYVSLARRYATYVRDHGDNTVYRIAAGANADDYRWTETLLSSFDDLAAPGSRAWPFQAVSLHYYTMTGDWSSKGSATGFDEEEWYRALRNASRIQELVSRHEAVMDRWDPQRKVGLVVDEWGAWWDVEPGTNPGFLYQQNTLRDALVASVHLDTFHRHAARIVMANVAQTVNVLQAMILTDPETDALVLTPTYHVFAMNRAHHDAASLAVTFTSEVPSREVAGERLATVSASASTRGDTALVSLSNLDAQRPTTVILDLRGRDVTGHRATILTADALDAHNTPSTTRVAPQEHVGVTDLPGGLEVELPAHAYVTVALDLA
jgi:alpha-L-arabinofuranosidase